MLPVEPVDPTRFASRAEWITGFFQCWYLACSSIGASPRYAMGEWNEQELWPRADGIGRPADRGDGLRGSSAAPRATDTRYQAAGVRRDARRLHWHHGRRR